MKHVLTLLAIGLLSACANHSHYHVASDADHEAYYSYDYDPYYGYSDPYGQYSTAGDGIYFNNYNYYPDRWGVSYSSIHYSPYRYPRLGFYYHNQCYYAWDWSCHRNWHSSYAYWGGWSWYNNYHGYYGWSNYWWNRPVVHYSPRYGRYSAREEAQRLADRNRNRGGSNKAQANYGSREQKQYGVSRERTVVDSQRVINQRYRNNRTVVVPRSQTQRPTPTVRLPQREATIRYNRDPIRSAPIKSTVIERTGPTRPVNSINTRTRTESSRVRTSRNDQVVRSQRTQSGPKAQRQTNQRSGSVKTSSSRSASRSSSKPTSSTRSSAVRPSKTSNSSRGRKK